MDETTQQLMNEINSLKEELAAFKQLYSVHQHNDIDGTNHLRKNIILDQDQGIIVGVGGMLSNSSATGSVDDVYNLYTAIGPDSNSLSLGNTSLNMQ